MNSRFTALALACAVVPGCAAAGFADTSDVTAVTVPVGSWLAAFLDWLQPLAVTAAGASIAYVAARAGGPLAILLTDKATDAMLLRAIDYAFGAVVGVEKGKSFTIEAGNDVLAAAERYAVSNAPLLAARLGDRLRVALFARLASAGGVPATASAENYNAAIKPSRTH